MQMIRAGLAVSLLLVLAAGCHSRTTETEFQAEAIAAACSWRARCGQVPDEASCVADLTPVGFPGSSGPHAAFDPDEAAACLDALRAKPCSYANGPEMRGVLACTGALHGTLADGATCVTGGECLSGSCSVDPACRWQCCPGTCESTLQRGDTCAIFGTGPSTSCHGDTACSCLDGPCTCKARVADGEPCFTERDCPDGSVCAFSVTTFAGVCQTPLAAGAPCAGDLLFECEEGLHCETTTHTCASLRPVGADCSDDDLACVEWALCVAGTCTALPRLGEACDQQCMAGYECSDGTCVRPPVCR